MGSLVSGWDSRAIDPKSVANERNRSFTKEEIEAYWRSHKKPGDDSKDHQIDVNNYKIRERSKSLPPMMQKLPMRKTWWERSNWAFLNEPPVIDGDSKTKI